MTKSMHLDDHQARDGEATRRLAQSMRWWTSWTMRWMILEIAVVLIFLIASRLS
jgi:hypothetical protein